MARYIAKRTLQAIPLLFLISVILFVLMQSIGDPVATMGGRQPLDERDRIRLRCQLGLDQPILTQYVYWLIGNDWTTLDTNCNGQIDSEDGTGNLYGVLRADFGTSITDRRPVTVVIGERIGNTLLLMIPAQILIIILGLGIGIFSALRQYSFLDNLFTALSYIFQSMPIFLIALMLVYIFAVNLKLLPPNGMFDPLGDRSFVDVIRHMILPVSAITLISVAGYARYMRANMLEVLNADYVRTARAKGLAEPRVTLVHALKNASLPIVTLIGLDLGSLIAGAVVTESIFAWPGMGSLFLERLGRDDYPVLMGILMLTTLSVIVFQLLTDIAYTWLDPRIRY
ncbi:MAG: ABC transporter permease [Anaerolineae bacterium]